MDDFDELVSSLTPRQDSASLAVYQNTVSIACPACGESFDSLVVCRESFNTLELDAPMDLCTTVHEGNPLLFTHRH
jgi:predicted RNA-binding Zn-ribbon protein involved in translation (DUF1610 family)